MSRSLFMSYITYNVHVCLWKIGEKWSWMSWEGRHEKGRFLDSWCNFLTYSRLEKQDRDSMSNSRKVMLFKDLCVSRMSERHENSQEHCYCIRIPQQSNFLRTVNCTVSSFDWISRTFKALKRCFQNSRTCKHPKGLHKPCLLPSSIKSSHNHCSNFSATVKRYLCVPMPLAFRPSHIKKYTEDLYCVERF